MKKNTMLYIVLLSLIMPMLLPVFAYAYDAQPVIIADGNEYHLTTQPTKNEIGLMVDAREISEAFLFDYSFNPTQKTFEIYNDTHGIVTFGHNATVFYSGNNEYNCKPFFYVQNGIPMVDAGMFCDMFEASYTYNEAANEIVIETGKISDNLPKINVDGEISPLFIEPFEAKDGFTTDLLSLASALNIEYSFESEETIKLYNEEKGNVYLTDSASSFESDLGTFDCAPLFFIEHGVPLISIRFFCELFDFSYEYDKDIKMLTIHTDVTLAEAEENTVETMSTYDATISGTVYYKDGAPSGGTQVQLILQEVGYRYSLYGYASYYAGNTYTLGTADFAEGEIYSDYCYSVNEYCSSNYPYYSLFYQDDYTKESGYINTSSGITLLKCSPFEVYDVYSDAMKFSSSTSYTKNFTVGNVPSVSGTVSLASSAKAPLGGININLMLQTVTSLRYASYGYTYYIIGNTYDLGTVHIDENENSSDYTFATNQYYSYTYPYYHLFYTSPDNDCVMPYGYLNESNKIVNTASDSWGTNISNRTDAYNFTTSSYEIANIVLPLRDDYISPVQRAEMPISSKKSGNVYLGDKITLTTETEGATIYYTIDGSMPTESSPIYTEPIVIDNDMTVKAIAVKDGILNSNISTYEYTVLINDEYKISVNDEIGIFNKKIHYFYNLPFDLNNYLYCPVRTLGEGLDLNIYWDDELSQVICYNDQASLTLSVGEGNCCTLNSIVYVNTNLIFETFLSDKYTIEYKNGVLRAYVKKDYASEIEDISVTNITGSGIVSFEVSNLSDGTTVYVGAYDENGVLLSIKNAEVNGDKMAAIISLEDAKSLKIFAWENNTLIPLSISKDYELN